MANVVPACRLGDSGGIAVCKPYLLSMRAAFGSGKYRRRVRLCSCCQTVGEAARSNRQMEIWSDARLQYRCRMASAYARRQHLQYALAIHADMRGQCHSAIEKRPGKKGWERAVRNAAPGDVGMPQACRS